MVQLPLVLTVPRLGLLRMSDQVHIKTHQGSSFQPKQNTCYSLMTMVLHYVNDIILKLLPSLTLMKSVENKDTD